MAENTKISWADMTLNPWIGCTKVSDGCKYCYAERDTFARTQRSRGRELWGPLADRHRTSEANWRKPYSWNSHVYGQCSVCGTRAKFDINDRCPGCDHPMVDVMVKTRLRVFVASLSDVCDDHKSILPEWRDDLAKIVRECSNIDWMFLTKRPELFNHFWQGRLAGADGYYPGNLWVGTTVENAKTAHERLYHLSKIRSHVRWLSCEPLLGSIDLRPYLALTRVDWVIAGGESGPEARPMNPNWVRSLREQCVEAKIPFHFKQWGEYAPNGDVDLVEGVGVAQFGDGMTVYRFGKHNTGRVLDGRVWDQFPVSKWRKAVEGEWVNGK